MYRRSCRSQIWMISNGVGEGCAEADDHDHGPSRAEDETQMLLFGNLCSPCQIWRAMRATGRVLTIELWVNCSGTLVKGDKWGSARC